MWQNQLPTVREWPYFCWTGKEKNETWSWNDEDTARKTMGGKRISVKTVQHVVWSTTSKPTSVTSVYWPTILLSISYIVAVATVIVITVVKVITIVKITTTVMVATVSLIITNCKTLIWLAYRYDLCRYINYWMSTHVHIWMIHLIKLFYIQCMNT